MTFDHINIDTKGQKAKTSWGWAEHLKLGARYQLAVADAKTLAELQLRIDWHVLVDEMQKKAWFSELPFS